MSACVVRVCEDRVGVFVGECVSVLLAVCVRLGALGVCGCGECGVGWGGAAVWCLRA